jgi:hypothetical protein
VPERKPGFFAKIKEDENFNHPRGICFAFHRQAQILAKKTVFVQALSNVMLSQLLPDKTGEK